MEKKIGLRRLLIAMIGAFTILVCYLAYGIWSYGEKNQLVQCDAAIVLGAAVWKDKPSPVLEERINHAVWLYENGYVGKIIFTGGRAEADECAESQVSRDYAIEKGVKAEDIFIETKSKITEQNLQYAYDIGRENDFKTFIVVSDPLHMKRAILIAKHQGMKVYSSPTPSSAYKTLKSKVPFLLRELFFYVGYIVRIPFR